MDEGEGTQVQNSAPVGPLPQEGAQVAQQPEKVLKQSEVNELVGRIKHEAYAKGIAAAQAAQPMQAPPQGNVGGSMGGMTSPVTEDQIRQMIAQEAQKQSQMNAAHHKLSNFVQQMGAGKGKYSDFDETVAKLGDLRNIPHIVEMATDTGMAHDVMYELGRNPGKIASLTTLEYLNPDLAKQEMGRLAESIKQNQQATNAPSPNEPLSHLKPSNATADSGQNAIRDLRRKPWARA